MRHYKGEVIYVKINPENASATALGKRYIEVIFCPECGFRKKSLQPYLINESKKRIFNDVLVAKKYPLLVEGELWRSTGTHDFRLISQEGTIYIGSAPYTPWVWGFCKAVLSTESPIELVEEGYSIVQSCSRRKLYLYPLEYTPGEELDKECPRCLVFNIGYHILKNKKPEREQGNLKVYTLPEMDNKLTNCLTQRDPFKKFKVCNHYVSGVFSSPCFKVMDSYVRLIRALDEVIIKSPSHDDITIQEGLYILAHPIPKD